MRRAVNRGTLPSFATALVFAAFALGLAYPASSDAADLKSACHEDASRILCYATPRGGPGYLRNQAIGASAKLEDILAALGSMPSKKNVEIQLLTETSPTSLTVYQHKLSETEQVSYLIEGYEGSKDHQLIIRGIVDNGTWLTQFEGKPLDEITNPKAVMSLSESARKELPTAPANAGDLNDFLADLADTAPQEKFELMEAGKSASYPIFCLEIRKSTFIILTDLAFDECWLSAVYASEVRHMSVLGSRFVGSRDAIFATAESDPDKATDPDNARFYEIAHNFWTSDIGPDIWNTVPWGVTHDGVYATRNGSLFASRNIAGSVRFHHNTIRYTYNGIRLVAKIRRGCNESCVKKANKDVEIHDNRFEFVRDNPVEPEGRAERWAIFHNEFYNSYAPISMDGVRDGPIYVWGNRAWYDDIPGKLCVDGPQWVHGTVYLFGANPPQWAAVDPSAEYDPYCATHRQGRIFKLGPLATESASLPTTVKELPGLYVFHNSWFIRSPLFGGGLLYKLGHWNNAIFFTNCASTGGESCRVMEPTTEQPYAIYPTRDGQALYYNLFSIYDPATFDDDHPSASTRLPYDSHHNISNRGFPEVDGLDGIAQGSKEADPMFVNPGIGNFALRPGSPALRAACEIDDKKIDDLKCVPFQQPPASDIGAVQSDPRFGAPLFDFKSPVPDERAEFPVLTD